MGKKYQNNVSIQTIFSFLFSFNLFRFFKGINFVWRIYFYLDKYFLLLGIGDLSLKLDDFLTELFLSSLFCNDTSVELLNIDFCLIEDFEVFFVICKI